MSSYSELIKNFEKIRNYMREFYVFGFKSRDEYNKKSARSYDDERRRIESWLGDHMSFVRTPEGKNVFISIDSQVSQHNPFYKTLKAKSFTDGDITLHFILFDILHSPEIVLSLPEIIEKMDEYFSVFESPMMFDESTVRKKLKEYIEQGIVMPDVHAGKGCTIGTTMTVTDKVVPNMVGVDIGCGIYTVNLDKVNIDLAMFDEAAHSIPCGRNVWESRQERFDLTELCCFRNLKDTKRLERSLGTLGGGNHFIEIDTDEVGNKYLIIHSGSRNLGAQVAQIYQGIAVDLNLGKEEYFKKRDEIIRTYKEDGRRSEIQATLKRMAKEWEAKEPTMPYELCYLYGTYLEDYLHDINICQKFAMRNREKMAEILLEKTGLVAIETFQTIHNYIDVEEMILRKGSVSAKAGEKLLIPINMRDGSLICVGKGNADWNYSAPHGAGRLMSRSAAFERLTMEEYEKQMTGIYTTCVNTATLDESPMAYKNMEDIVANIEPTAEIIAHIKPIYNFKAAE